MRYTIISVTLLYVLLCSQDDIIVGWMACPSDHSHFVPSLHDLIFFSLRSGLRQLLDMINIQIYSRMLLMPYFINCFHYQDIQIALWYHCHIGNI